LASIPEDSVMKAKRKKLTAATLSAFLALAGAIQARSTGGDKNVFDAGKKPGKVRTYKGGKKGHKGRRKSRKGGGDAKDPAPK
jgi:hypothetical protein